MLNTGKLAGRTVFITGASRGIGKEIALKVAKDGANVVIAAKTAEPNAKLDGTIFSAAEEIVRAGGKCLPCQVDIRNEEQVQKAVEKAVQQFGGIDILINNASAISLTGTLDTPMKRYDLMHQINSRGTYLVTQKCIPYLKQSKNPHVLNISPPLNMNPMWFKNHVAYTMAKYGMSMCVLGMSEELKTHNIAVNALWPRTAIWTAAMKMLGGGDEVSKQCRKPQIMADAAYVVLTKDSRNFTGHFAIDEEVLKEAGVSEMSQYAVQPGHPLMPDFFLDEALTMMHQFETIKGGPGLTSATKAATPKSKDSSGAQQGGVANVFKKLKASLTSELVQKSGYSYAFNLTGSEAGSWYLAMKTGDGDAGAGELPGGSPDVTFTMDSADFVKMFRGELKPTAAFMSGKLKLKGKMEAALKLDKLMSAMQSKL